MNKIMILLFVLFAFLVIGCSKEKSSAEITGEVSKVEQLEVIEEVGEVKDFDEEIVTVRLCYDSDSGRVRWKAGEIFGFHDNAKRFEYHDYCFDNNILIEYYCEDENPENMTFICKNGCSENHCL